MARSKLTTTDTDLISDGGTVLFSFIQGEQLEYPLILEFITEDVANYTLEAVVVEAANDGSGTKPTTIQPAGDKVALPIRLPSNLGAWNSSTAYSNQDYVLYNGTYYLRNKGIAVVDATSPDLSPDWDEYDEKTIFIQFPKELSVTPSYNVQPEVGLPIYGFFELRVTEPNNAFLTRTWKPIRGMVELLFSPTDLVPDV
jgi:hypothetical protein